MATCTHTTHGKTARTTAHCTCIALLWASSFLFALRVLGQALQRWLPLPFLPPFHAFQGSRLPYFLLLPAQIAILAVMVRVAWRAQRGTPLRSRHASAALAWAGGIYITASLGRIAIGLALPHAPAWFSTWIPAAFHVVLAGFVVTLAVHQRHESSHR